MKILIYWLARFVYRFNKTVVRLVDTIGTGVGSTALYVMIKFGARPKVEAFLEGELRRNAEQMMRGLRSAGGPGLYVVASAPPRPPSAPPTMPPADGLN
jgi:hypothetical protein